MSGRVGLTDLPDLPDLPDDHAQWHVLALVQALRTEALKARGERDALREELDGLRRRLECPF